MSGGDILQSAAAAALVVISGALYALCFALGRLHQSPWLGRAGWLAYGVLAVSAIVLANVLQLRGGWLLLVAAMLVGYWFAPGAIWQLSDATHRSPLRPADHTQGD